MSALDLTREEAIELLAARLYWKMDQLDPGLDDVPAWADLPERDRRFYRLCVEDLLAFERPVQAVIGGGSGSTLATTR